MSVVVAAVLLCLALAVDARADAWVRPPAR
jgi:hypothetical protein